MSNPNNARAWFRNAIIAALLILGAYAYIYQAWPFEDIINDLLLNLLIILSAVLNTLAGLLILRSYGREDATYRVWLFFVIGFALWAAAEIAWAYYNMTLGEVPVPSLPDYLWIAGYVFFGLGFVKQYQVLFSTPASKGYLILVLALVSSLIVTYFVQQLWGEPGSLGNFVDLYYPVADFFVLLVALGLVYTFRQGFFGRPWLTMVVFTISDALYAWLTQSGAYAYLADSGDYASMIVDTLYMAAYLSMALGFLMQYLVIKHGPWAFSSPPVAQE